MLLLAAYYHVILAFGYAFAAIFLMVVILLQRGRGVGLSGAFGGAGGASTAFGAKTGDFLTWVTVVGAGMLLAFTVILNYFFVETPPQLGPAPAPAGAPAPTTQPGRTGQLTDPAALPDYAQLEIFGEPVA
jgi:preprotein translocase subunit SecG